MTDKKIRFAILGTGPRWLSLSNTYMQHPNMEIVALCDIADGAPDEAKEKLCSAYDCDPKLYSSYEQMIKDAKYDAIMITCDPDIQVDYAVNEMDRGIHVMTEVPAAYTIDQCYSLVNAVKRNGVKYQLAEQTRYWNFIEKWRGMAERGEFGKIYYAEGEYLHFEQKWDYFRHKATGKRIWTDDPSYENDPEYERSWRYRTFTDPILYLPHELSPLLSITGGRITSVSCMGTRPQSYYTEGFDVRDIECAIMHNSNDAVFCVRAGFTTPFGSKRSTGAHWYQIKGTKQTVEWARSKIDNPKAYVHGEGWAEHPEWGTSNPNASEEFRNAEHGGADYYPMYYFMDAILNDKTPPMDVYRAVETAAPAILAAESARRGGELLEVPDFRS